MTRTFNFPSNPNYGVVHDDCQKNNADSLFRDVYTKAFLKVCEIIKSVDSSHNIDEIINTCIAFVGGRGSGKSSSMATVADYLDSLNISDDEARRVAKQFQENGGETVCSKRYYVLKSIEVSHMTTNTTVLGNISAQMHDKVMEKKDISLEDKREFFEAARLVNRYTIMSKSGNWSNETNDNIIGDISTIIHMREHINRMIKLFVNIVLGRKDGYVVLQIDDLDMSIGNVYDVMEEIYTYLTIPNVIILISVAEGLLKRVLTANYQEQFKNPKEDFYQMSRNLSNNYIAKLLPLDRRIMMPLLDFGNIKNILINIDGKIPNGYDTAPNIQDYMLTSIHRKTMLILCENEMQRQHYIIPTNLRALYNFYFFLESMPNLYNGKEVPNKEAFGWKTGENGEELRRIANINLNALGEYILNNYLDFYMVNYETMSKSHRAVIEVLCDIIDNFFAVNLKDMNASIIVRILSAFVNDKNVKNDNYLSIIFINKLTRCNNTLKAHVSKYMLNLLESALHSDSISMGDVMYVLGQLDKHSENELIRYLVEIIRVLWSIRMTREFYVECTKPYTDDSGHIGHIIDRTAVGLTNTAFRIAVGGFFINPDNYYSRDHLTGWIKTELNYATLKTMYTKNQQAILALFTSYRRKSDDGKSFRNCRTSLGEVYYRCIASPEKTTEKRILHLHPMSLFTNTLDNSFAIAQRSLLFNAKYSDEILSKFQPNLLVPLFSLDCMVLYYENLFSLFFSGITIKCYEDNKFTLIEITPEGIESDCHFKDMPNFKNIAYIINEYDSASQKIVSMAPSELSSEKFVIPHCDSGLPEEFIEIINQMSDVERYEMTDNISDLYKDIQRILPKNEFKDEENQDEKLQFAYRVLSKDDPVTEGKRVDLISDYKKFYFEYKLCMAPSPDGFHIIPKDLLTIFSDKLRNKTSVDAN